MKCRVCGNVLEKLLKLSNIPKAAQHLPTLEELSEDSGVSLNLMICSCCGLVQHDLPPVSYYKNVIRANAYSTEMKDFRLAQLKELVYKYGLKGKKVLEIGSGNGEYLSLLEDCGLIAFGVENSKESVLKCKREGLKAINAFMGDGKNKLKDGPFDAFFSFNFFEHLPSLASAISEIKDNLTQDAIGLIEVPNFDMIIKDNLISEIIPDHIYYFTKRSITNILESNGFDVLSCKSIWHDYIISCVVKVREKLDVQGFIQYQQQLKLLIHNFVEKYPKGKVVVWGAGHQSLTALAMCNKEDIKKISFIIDSAPFKQNKYSPVTHIKIVSPEVLKTTEIKAILVIAAAYNNEISNYIKKHHKNVETKILSNN